MSRSDLDTLLRGTLKANLIHHLAHTGDRKVLLRIGREAQAALPAWEKVPATYAKAFTRVFSGAPSKLGEEHPGFLLLRDFVLRDPAAVWPHIGLGLAYLRVWDGDASFRKAKAHFTRAVELRPTWGWAHLLLGEANRSLLDYETSLADYDRAIALEPKLAAWGYAFRSRVLFQIRTASVGLADMDKALLLAPKAGWMYAWRAEAYRRLGRGKEAAADFARALKLDPLYDQAYCWRAKLLRAEGRVDEALASLKRGIALCPDFEKARREQVRLLRDAGRTGAALQALDAAVALNHRNSYSGLWRADAAGPEALKALEELDRWLEKKPRDLRAQAWRGETLAQLGRIPEALEVFDSLLIAKDSAQGLRTELRGLRAWIHAWRGEALLRGGRLKEAVVSLDRSLSLDPSYGRAWAWRGRAKALAEDWASAEDDLDMAISVRRIEYSWIYGWRGEARLKLGRWREAAADLDIALNLDPNVAQFYYWRGAARLRLGAREQGRADLERARQPVHA